jgi:hypothetical protein
MNVCLSMNPFLQDLTTVSGSILLRLPLGAGAILGVYVTVLVTTSRMCRMLDLDSLLACPGVVGVPAAAALMPGVSGAAGRFEPGVSAALLDLSAASQSKGDFTDAALSGDLGEYMPEAAEMAGEAGSFMLGNTDAPVGGADRGQLPEPRGVGDRFVSIGTGFGLLGLSLAFSSHSQLSSDRAVDGALSTCSALSFSGSSDSVELLLLVLVLLRVVLAVLVRFKTAFPVCGGEVRFGETRDMLFRKSRYATGGEMGVFWRSCSSLIVALKGPAEGSPAEGSPDEGIGSRKADVRETADKGVFAETAEGSDTAERSSGGGGGILGKFAVTGVDSLRAGLDDMMAARMPGRWQVG